MKVKELISELRKYDEEAIVETLWSEILRVDLEDGRVVIVEGGPASDTGVFRLKGEEFR